MFPQFEVTALTAGSAHHFFGYYDKCPWSEDGRTILATRYEGDIKAHRGGEVAQVGMIDLEGGASGGFQAFDETTAWCWQQGCMLQWLRTPGSREVIYNQYDGSRFISVIRNVDTGRTRTLPMPIYSLSPDGRHAVTLDFARLGHTRPGYGYPVASDPQRDVRYPKDVGLWIVDLQTGDCKLIFSLHDAAMFELPDVEQTGIHWFNHLEYNTDGSRISMLHRFRTLPDNRTITRFITINPDGSDPYVMHAGTFSHYDWRDETHIAAWAERPDKGQRCYLFTDRTRDATIVGNHAIFIDGHMTYSPDRRWLMTDTYPSSVDRCRTLMLLELATDRRIDIGRFYSPPEDVAETRCDLHPRWNRDGTKVCIDSMHINDERQLYTIDVSSLTCA